MEKSAGFVLKTALHLHPSVRAGVEKKFARGFREGIRHGLGG
jgi:hypothetical protein